MGETITSKGKTVKEALDLALTLLNKKQSEVEIEILKHEEKGFLGIKSKPAVVKVTVKPSESEKIEESKTIDSLILSDEINEYLDSSDSDMDDVEIRDIELEGKVWIIDGKVYCKDAKNMYPLIEPTKDVKVYKNGTLIHSTQVISQTDVIKVEIVNDEIPSTWEIKLSPDMLEAFLVVREGKKISRRLKDKQPSNYVRLEVEEVRTPVVIDAREVLEKLKELQITHGVDYEAISLACAASSEGEILIAKGIPPLSGENGRFHLINNIEVKKQMKERLDGTVDFREIQGFPSVDYGQIIGEVLPPIEGKPGINIKGEVISPEPVHPLQLKVGTGVLLVEDTKVVAIESGQPEVNISGPITTVSVTPKLIFNKDVTLETGNIRYMGAIEINGSIQDGMSVEAKGNIFVTGNTYRAEVLSGKSIIVRNNVIGSNLTAGNRSEIKVELSNLLMELENQLYKMSAAITQLTQIQAFKANSLNITGLGPLVKILCESKFKEFPLLANEIINKIREHSSVLEKEWENFADRLHRDFITIHFSDLKSEEDICDMAAFAESLYKSVHNESDFDNISIRSKFVQNSQLYSSGDIIITGQGVYSSSIYSRKNVIIDGFVRGGQIFGEEHVYINEIDHRAGTKVKVAVSKKGTIKINRASENTTIQVGGQVQTLFNNARNIEAKLDEIGRLVIRKEE